MGGHTVDKLKGYIVSQTNRIQKLEAELASIPTARLPDAGEAELQRRVASAQTDLAAYHAARATNVGPAPPTPGPVLVEISSGSDLQNYVAQLEDPDGDLSESDEDDDTAAMDVAEKQKHGVRAAKAAAAAARLCAGPRDIAKTAPRDIAKSSTDLGVKKDDKKTLGSKGKP